MAPPKKESYGHRHSAYPHYSMAGILADGDFFTGSSILMAS
jgi:hypothetical protein